MPEVILPSTMVGSLVAFERCLRAPSSRAFGLPVAGWIRCPGCRTIGAVAVASGGAEGRHWEPLPLARYGRPVAPLAFCCTALWYGALRDRPVRIVVVRDPGGRRQPLITRYASTVVVERIQSERSHPSP